MIYSNLAGTTSDEFKIGAGGSGKIISKNAYDIFWRGRADGSQINPNVTRIPNGTDLNTMFEIGQYFMPSNAESPTLINCPTKVSFIMTIEPSVGVSYNDYRYIIQKIIDFSGVIYCRGYDGNGKAWSGWSQTIPTPTLKELPAIESGTFSFTPTYDRLVLSNPRAWYNRVGNMVFVYATSGFTLLDNNTPYIVGSFQGLPYKYDNEYFGFGNCAIKYYPIDSTKVSCGFSCWTASSTGLGFRISINCISTDSNGQYISTDYPFGMAMKANIQSFFQAGFWYKMA